MDARITIDGEPYAVRDALVLGLRHHQAGRFAPAETIYRQVLAIDAGHADSLHLCGLIAYQRGELQSAVALIGRAIESAPGRASYYSNLGNALRDLDRPDEAIRQYRAAIAHQPDLPELHYNLANALCERGQLAEAESSYRTSLALRPDYADAHYNFGNALVGLRRWEEAAQCYRACLRGGPSHLALNNLGLVLYELGRLEEAERSCREALLLQPLYAEAHYNLGCVLRAAGDADAVILCYEQALALKPDYGASRLARCMAELPILYAEESEIGPRRTAYAAALDRLGADIDIMAVTDGLADGVGTHQPFFLAYQGRNDRALQQRYGALMCRLMARRYPAAALPPPPDPGERIRVGIVSGFFCDHTIWRLFLSSWVRTLDRRRFDVVLYHTGSLSDAETATAAAGGALCRGDRRSGREWRDAILADRPHILLYPEIGMDPMAAHLAAQRLARVQCVAWGHPETTGMPTIDYFLSSALMEPEDGEEHYSERLIRLPNLGTLYEPDGVTPAPADRAAFGLRPDAAVFWSGQALYKYLPQFDFVFPRIARAVPESQFVFIEFARSRRVTELFRQRLARAFAALGLSAEDHCVMLPSLKQDRFLAAVGRCDVVLDTIGWSGGRSTLDCLSQNPAIVTLPGALMRSRHTAAILRRMDAAETIAGTLDDYVALAIRLAQDSEFRSSVRARVARNKDRVFNDRATIAGLEDFLEAAARGLSPG